MTIVGLVTLAVVIGANNLATALALGAMGQADRKWRIIAVFGAFEFLIPLLGLWLGQQAAAWISEHAGWLSGALLAGLGVVSLVAGIRGSDRDEKLGKYLTSKLGLLLLAAGLSLDNLVVGFSLGLRDSSPLLVAATISVFSMVFTFVGIEVGHHSRRHWEKAAQIGGGVLLIALGVAASLGWL